MMAANTKTNPKQTKQKIVLADLFREPEDHTDAMIRHHQLFKYPLPYYCVTQSASVMAKSPDKGG